MSTEDEYGSGRGGRGGNASVHGNSSVARGGPGGKGVIGPGGPGGDARVEGNNSTAVGGPGGRGGLGEGGPGGKAFVGGDNEVHAGGEGGESNQPDGRGGRGGRSGYVVLGLADYELPDGRRISEFGRGGDGACSPQYLARLMVIEDILGRPINMRSESAGFHDSDTAATTLASINETLRRDGHSWQVRITAGCLEFYDA